MPVAIYCGSGASADSSGIPYWLVHVKGAQGSAAKMKVRSEEGIPHSFRPSGVQFKRNASPVS
jgi:hypothetical protein